MTEAEQPRTADFASKVGGMPHQQSFFLFLEPRIYNDVHDLVDASLTCPPSQLGTAVDDTNPPPALSEPVGISGSDDPFAAQRSDDNNPFTERSDSVGELGSSPPIAGSPKRDRRMSKEWDASKVPPSRFQKREGSIYATPGSRDGHVQKNNQQAYEDKLKSKGWFNTK
ncbi:MAG: hypothetical protein M4579_002131 [Chaenotheca gracillima]|nr:MAG: hypothetical protein M4579_002131 [Chaenotheca gracillima]